ncbi:MAG TPA: 4-hydroxybenzoate octaprenyltransferase [bacterium]|nr:4-hydroxybenzoate octaprenyltransferase [bacterium]
MSSKAARVITYYSKLIERWTKDFAKLIRIEQTLLSLPFACTGALLAGGILASYEKWLCVIVAIVSARTAGITLNRIIDFKYDSMNPRSGDQSLSLRRMRRSSGAFSMTVSIALLLYSSYSLNPLSVVLFPLVFLLTCVYPHVKRFTWASHFFLGLILACAPLGGWIGIRGSVDLPIAVFAGATMFWVAGFDVIYACQDHDFDREKGLCSIPIRFGVDNALNIALGFHAVTILLLLAAGVMLDMHSVYYIGVSVGAMILIYEHGLVVIDKRRYDSGFFVANTWFSIVLFVFTLAEKVAQGN